MIKNKKVSIVMFELFISLCLFFTTVQASEASSSVIFQGIDISQWQREIDFEQVANDDIQIVYIKSSEGTSYVDPYFETNYEKAKQEGLKVGVYHYLTARTVKEAEDEAQFFAATISGKSVDCKLAMDFESFGNLTNSEINEISQVFLNKLQQLTGKEVIIYSDVYNAKNIFSVDLANRYPIWVAEYGVSRPGYTNWNKWEGFQYTSRGRIKGIRGYVDLDKFTEDILLRDTTSIPQEISRPESTNLNTIYVVQRGNTLSGIAMKFKTSVDSIVKLNNIKNPNIIYTGQALQIPAVNSVIIQNNTIKYIVKRGDTLSQIAKRFETTVESIVRLNNIKNPNLIYINQVLKIQTNTNIREINDLNHILYTVKRGDTLSRISEKYRVSISEIVELNEIKNPNLIYVGEILRINN